MDGFILRSVLKERKANLMLFGFFAIGIALVGAKLFDRASTLAKEGPILSVVGMILLIPFSLRVLLDIVSVICVLNNKDMRIQDCIARTFVDCTAIGGTILVGISLFSKLADNTKFIIGTTGFALLVSSLLCHAAYSIKYMKDEYQTKKDYYISDDTDLENMSKPILGR
ncbi:hypothetical protein [Candidatus Mesenet endosymbiont of Agriotes lineatus]|uniref:hypothetical protein n=1 Tax=Candidatus Mesenet endosymbiont of Agriotes lineatus TaxID=3077948 RepID=UPI0030D561A2